MDFTLTAEQEQFRKEVRSFLTQEVKPHYDNPPLPGAHEYEDWYINLIKGLSKKIGAKGWFSMGWPQEYGGSPGTLMDQVIFKEEFGYYDNWGIPRQAVNMAGPTILLNGDDEQKQRLVPPIARGEQFWCQGYSEPEAGSDLAGIKTTAILEGDFFRVNGQKVWTSNATFCDRIFFLARSDPDAPKHRGISMLVADLQSPGITVRPITQMTGSSDDFTEVFFDNVMVPKENLIGDLHRGWYVAMGQLSGERSQIDFVSFLKRRLDDMTQYVGEARRDGSPLRDDPVTRDRLAEMHLEWQLAKLLNYRVVSLQMAGEDTSTAASVCKAVVGPLTQRMAATAIRVLGLHGQLGAYGEEAPRAPFAGRLMNFYLRAVSRTFNAGTHEIQQNIIATRGLGLPAGS